MDRLPLALLVAAFFLHSCGMSFIHARALSRVTVAMLRELRRARVFAGRRRRQRPPLLPRRIR